MFGELLTFAVVLVMYQVVEPALVRLPQNTAVKRDSQVTMKCSSDNADSFITWFNTLCATYNRDTDDCIRVYNGYSSVKYGPRFSVTKVNNATHVTRDLNINPTQLTDAGVYVCVENRPGQGVQQTRSAQLIVVGEVRCTTNVSASGVVQENDVIMMTCSVTYSGNWAPVMRWFNSSHNFTDDDINSTTSNTTVTSQLMITASAKLHGSQIVCATYFAQSRTPLSTTATNVPSYTDMWTSPKINVSLRFAPRNLRITPRQSSYQPGDRILCSAQGNPEPSYQWTDLVNGTVIEGDVLIITEDMVGKDKTFRCAATNSYNGMSYSNSTIIEFFGKRETHSTQTTVFTPTQAHGGNDNNAAVIAGIVVGVCIALLIVVIVVIVLLRKRKSQNSEEDVKENNDYAYTNEVVEPTDSTRYVESDVDQPAESNPYENVGGVVYASLERPSGRPPASVEEQQPETLYAPIISA